MSQAANEFLANCLIPGLLSLVDSDLYLTVYDCDYKVVFTTNKSALSNGLAQWTESVGTSYANPPEAIIANLLTKNKEFTRELIVEESKKYFALQQEVMYSRKTLRLIDMLPYDNRYEGFLTSISPLWLPNTEQVIGLLTISEALPIIGVEDLFKLKDDRLVPRALMSSAKPPFNLSPRQWEILFLLTIGLDQAKIARLLDIKRGTVSKIMIEILFDKFQVNTKEQLVESSIKLGLNKIIPKSLWKHHLILLD